MVSAVVLEDVAEGDVANGTIRVARLGDLSSSLTVNFSVSGTATSGTDFTSLGTSVTLPATPIKKSLFITTVDSRRLSCFL